MSSLRRQSDVLVTRGMRLLGGLAASIFAITIPFLYFGLSVYGLQESHRMETAHLTKTVEKIIQARPDLWEFEHMRLLEVVSQPSIDGDLDERTIRTAAGTVVVKTDFSAKRPAITVSAALFDSGIPVGSIEARHSIRKQLFVTALLGMLSSSLGYLLFFIFRTYPVRRLDNALADLQRAEKEQRLSRETAERLAEETAIIAEIGRVIGSTLEINEVYERFAVEAKKLISFDRIAVNLKHPHEVASSVAYVAGLDIPSRRQGTSTTEAGSLNGAVLSSRTGLLIQPEGTPEGIAEIVSRFPLLSPSFQAGLLSFLSVPLIYRDEAVGVLHFRSKKQNAYTEQDLRLAERIGAQIAGAIANAQLFSDRKRMEEEIREMSLRDLLTELYNRRGFITLAEQQIRAANRARRSMLVTFIDFDGLKWINDTFGHEEGDRALIDAANVLRQTFRESDIIARLGGDEFAVLSIDAADTNPEDFSKRLQENIDAGNTEETRPYTLAMSWGTAVYDPKSPLSLDELMSSADERMYAQKKAKSNR